MCDKVNSPKHYSFYKNDEVEQEIAKANKYREIGESL